MFNEFFPLKLFQVANIRFASVVVILKRLKLIKRCLQAMAISDQWAACREDDVGKEIGRASCRERVLMSV